MSQSTPTISSGSERFILVLLTAIQFTNILDFVIMMPLGPQLMRLFGISPREFGFVVSAYTFSAGISGFLAAFFLDRFDRKKALLSLYAGLTVGTFLCAVAPTYWFLLCARVVAGMFGGVLGATILSIIGDVIPYERRGNAMGMVMTAFSLAQVAGVPLGLMLANEFGWHAPFAALAGTAALCWGISARVLPPMRVHLESQRKIRPVDVVISLLKEGSTQRALGFTVALVAAGFAIIPYINPYIVSNVGRTESDLPLIAFFGGAATIVSSRVIGRLTDRYGKLPVFTFLAALSVVPILLMTNFPKATLPVTILAVTVFMVIVSGRFVPAMAMVTSAVDPARRGSFMSMNSSVQQFAAGIASFGSGLILGKAPDGSLTRFGIVGLIAAGATLACISLAKRMQVVEVDATLLRKGPDSELEAASASVQPKEFPRDG